MDGNTPTNSADGVDDIQPRLLLGVVLSGMHAELELSTRAGTSRTATQRA